MTVTLAEVNDTLKEQKTFLEKAANGLDVLSRIAQAQENRAGDAEEARREQDRVIKQNIQNQNVANNVSGVGGILAAPGIGIGAALGGLGALAGGLGSAGTGIGAFFLGLAGAEAIMSKFGNGENLKALLTNLAEGLSAFSGPQFLALGSLFAGASLFGVVAGSGSFKGGLGIAAIGAGIAAFLVEMSVADAAMKAWGGDGSALTTFMGNLSTALNSLTSVSGGSLGALFAAGGLFGAVAGPVASAKATIGIAAIGAGIAAFFTALAVGDMAISEMQATGASLKTLVGNVVDSISLFTGDAAVAIGALLATGGIFGPGMIGAAVGMGAIGTGIGLFFTGLAAGDAGITAMANLTGGEPGEGFKKLLVNTADGIMALASMNIDNTALTNLSGALMSISGAILTFFASDTVSRLKGLVDELGAGLGDALDTIFGTNFGGEARKGAVERIIDSLAPLSTLKSSDFEQIRSFSTAIDGLTASFTNLSNVKAEGFTVNLEKMLRGVSSLLEMKDVLLNGGDYNPRGFNLFGKDIISFGPEGTGGLNNLTDNQLETIRNGISKLYSAMGVATPAESLRPSGGVGVPADLADTISGTLKDLYVETLTVRQGLTTPAVNIVDASTRTGGTTVNAPTIAGGRPRAPMVRNETSFEF